MDRPMVLSFRLGKIPVRIQPSFFLMTMVLGSLGVGDVGFLLAWVIAVLLSVMLHELGHAGMGLVFGLEPSVVLHGMGGTTSWSTQRKLSTAQRVAISLAGPGAGFVVGAIVYVAPTIVRSALPLHVLPPMPLWRFVYAQLLFVNFGWGLMNLLPMLPLDGGNVMTQLLNALTGGRGERPARIVSVVLAALVVLLALGFQQWWPALLAVTFISSNWGGLKDLSAREHDAPMRAALDRAYAALDAKDSPRILELARPVALESRTESVRAEALQLLAFGFLLEGRVPDADAAIAALPRGYAPHPSLLELRASVAATGPAAG
jgi:stage IV sporulation protein FB